MRPSTEPSARWAERAARAVWLASRYPVAAELLSFYGDLTRYQSRLLRDARVQMAPLPDADATRFRDALDIGPALRAIPDFLRWLQAQGPPGLAAAARELQHVRDADWARAGERYVTEGFLAADGDDPPRAFVVAAMIQPWAEQLADAVRGRTVDASHAGDLASASSSASCPDCGGQPVVGALREVGHGAERSLVCSFCLGEYRFSRVVCPACGEQKFDALPVYTAEALPHVRVEACDTCRTYVKTIDLSKDGHAVPIADDLASVTLDLWAREQGYRRLWPNLLGS